MKFRSLIFKFVGRTLKKNRQRKRERERDGRTASNSYKDQEIVRDKRNGVDIQKVPLNAKKIHNVTLINPFI